ncbi:MAG TPA: flagellar protein FlaG [bacterium]|nr:flagellar protein FlaG [bacterium]
MSYDSPYPVTASGGGSVGSRSVPSRPAGFPTGGPATGPVAPADPPPTPAPVPAPAPPKPRSLEELAEALRRVNLTFDLFEIQAHIEFRDGQFRVLITNSRTGEVIRQIPAYEAPELAEALQMGVGVLQDLHV